MLTRVLRYLRSQVLGLIAIFIALGGTGYAAMSIPKHSIGQRALKNASVGTKQLRKHSVTNTRLAKSSVGTAQLRKGSVQGTQLKDGSVTSTKLAAGSVGTSQLAAGSVGSGQLAAGSVGSAQLAAGSVGSGQLAAGSVGSAQIAAGSVGPSQLTGVAWVSYRRSRSSTAPVMWLNRGQPAAATYHELERRKRRRSTFSGPVDGGLVHTLGRVFPAGSERRFGRSASICGANPAAQLRQGVDEPIQTSSERTQLVVVEIECAA